MSPPLSPLILFPQGVHLTWKVCTPRGGQNLRMRETCHPGPHRGDIAHAYMDCKLTLCALSDYLWVSREIAQIYIYIFPYTVVIFLRKVQTLVCFWTFSKFIPLKIYILSIKFHYIEMAIELENCMADWHSSSLYENDILVKISEEAIKFHVALYYYFLKFSNFIIYSNNIQLFDLHGFFVQTIKSQTIDLLENLMNHIHAVLELI